MIYKRLTKYNEYSHNAEVYAYSVDKDVYFDGVDIVCNENSSLAQETIDRLAELEDKIEQGTLIELPCKDLGAFPCEMGTTVWLIYKRYWNVSDKNGFWVLRESKVSPHNKKRFSDDFGKFVFLTREEAENQLKELNKDD